MAAIVQSLICSSCSKYLSVFPIKVYPNLSVKCGRCNSSDDRGTVSQLYEMLARNLLFPCVNRYEGCTKLLSPVEMKLHESNCTGTHFHCPVCRVFEGDSFAVVGHFKQDHPSRFLQHPEFLIVFDDKNEDIFYLYANSSENKLAVIYVRYDYLTKCLYVDIAPIYPGHLNGKRFLQSFELFTAYRKRMCKSSQHICAIYSDNGINSSCVDHSLFIKDDYFSNVALCKFLIQKNDSQFPMLNPEQLLEDGLRKEQYETKLVTREVVKYVDLPCNKQHFDFKPCTRDHVNDLPRLPFGTQMSMHNFRFSLTQIRSLLAAYSPIFYLANTSWRILVEKNCKCNTYYLSCFVEKLENSEQNKCSYKIDAEMSVLSFNEENSITMSFSEKIIGKRSNESMNLGFPTFIRWSILLDPNKKFLNANNEIQIAVDMKLLQVLYHSPRCHCQGCIESSSD